MAPFRGPLDCDDYFTEFDSDDLLGWGEQTLLPCASTHPLAIFPLSSKTLYFHSPTTGIRIASNFTGLDFGLNCAGVLALPNLHTHDRRRFEWPHFVCPLDFAPSLSWSSILDFRGRRHRPAAQARSH